MNRKIDDTVQINENDLDFLRQEKFEVTEDIIYAGRRKGSFLVFVTGPDRGNAIGIYSEKIVIGRDSSCDIIINKQYVSKRHAEIIPTEDKVILKDYGSTNGTLINDRPARRAELKDRDEIKIGNIILQYFKISLDINDSIATQAAEPAEPESEFYRLAFDILQPHFGAMTKQFLNRQVKSHLNKTPQNISMADREKLAWWIKISAGLLLDEKIAEKMAEKILSLKQAEGSL